MRRRIAFILSTIIFSCNVLIIANADLKKDNIEFERYEMIYNTSATDSDAIKATNSNASNNERRMRKEERDNMTCKVSFPTNIRACLDPGNLKGKGQIFSDSYVVENYGKNDIAVKIKNIQITDQNGEEIQSFFENENCATESNAKKVNIEMVWENETEQTEKKIIIENSSPDEYVLFLKGAKYDKDNEFISLDDGSKGLFYFTGTLDSDFVTTWRKSGLLVKFDYEIEIQEGVPFYD